MTAVGLDKVNIHMLQQRSLQIENGFDLHAEPVQLGHSRNLQYAFFSVVILMSMLFVCCGVAQCFSSNCYNLRAFLQLDLCPHLLSQGSKRSS